MTQLGIECIINATKNVQCLCTGHDVYLQCGQDNVNINSNNQINQSE